MVNQPQNPEFRINPENFNPCDIGLFVRKAKFAAGKQQRSRPLCTFE